MTEHPGPAGARAIAALGADPDPAHVLTIVNRMRGELAEKLGIEITEFTRDRVVATMPVDGNRQPFGLLHGGASAALAETMGSFHGSLVAPGKAPLGIDLNCTHHRSMTDGLVTAVSTPIHVGRTICTFDIVLSDERDRRVCSARLTVMLRDLGADQPAPLPS